MNSETIEKITGIGTFGLIAALHGWLGWLAVLYGVAMATDWMTGSALAIKEKKWNSSRARQGLWHKCGSIITVGVSALTDILLGLIINNMPGVQLPFAYNALLCPVVVVWYIISELGSILENAAGMGAPVPKFLKEILAKVEDVCETNQEK